METSGATKVQAAQGKTAQDTLDFAAPRTARWITAGLAVLLVMALVAAAGLGYIRLPFAAVAKILAARAFDQPAWIAHYEPVWSVVVTDVRLPRILSSVLVGAGLSLCGVVFQGILLNPLADPYTLGVSAGAAFGASVALLLNISLLGAFSVPLFAFLGATATLFLVIWLSSYGNGLSSTNLILSGIIVAAILSAGLSFIKYVADEQVSVIIFWLMGSFAARTWSDVVLVAAVCVAISGIIGFVGLLVPHLMRMLVGADNRGLLPASLLAGALLLLAADTLTRAVLPQEIPIGVLTALVGGPFFCWVFRQRQKEQRL